MKFKFKVTGDKLTVTEKNIPTYTGNINTYECEFEFSRSWGDIPVRIAVFNNVLVILDNNKCHIPAELLCNQGRIDVGVFGTNENEALKRISTNLISISVATGAYREGVAPTEPTPEFWEQAMRLWETKADADSVNSRLTVLDEATSNLTQSVSSLEAAQAETASRQTTAENKINALQGSTARHETSISSLTGRVSTQEANMNTANTNIANITARMQNAESKAQEIEDAVSDIDGRLAEVETEAEAMSESIADIEADVQATDTNVGELDSRLSDAEADIEDIKTRPQTGHTFNRQFNVSGGFVSVGNKKSEVVIDLQDIVSAGSGGYRVDLPSDNAAKITWRGVTDIVIPTSTSTSYGSVSNKYGKIISSVSGTLISLPAGVDYTPDMDLTKYDTLSIFPLMRDEYVDKDGYAYSFGNRLVTSVESAAVRTSYYRWLDSDGNTQTYSDCDGITLVNLYYKDSGNFNDNSIWNQRTWNTGTGLNGNEYYILNGQTQNKLEQFTTSWGLFPHIRPSSNDEVPYFYVTVKKADGNLIQLKTVSYTEFMLDNELNVATMDVNGRAYLKPHPDLLFSLNGSKFICIDGKIAFKNIYAIVKMEGSELHKSAEPIENVIKTYANGKLYFIPHEGVSEYASAFDGSFYTKNYDILPEAAYSDIQLGEVYGGHEGMLKHSIIPLPSSNLGTKYAPNGHISNSRTVPFPSVTGTKGTLYATNGMRIEIPELFSYKTVYDECNETQLIKRFSDEVLLTADMILSFERIGTSNGAIAKFRIPITSDENAPAVNSASTAANILQSGFEVKSENDITAYTTFGYDKYAVAFTYAANSDYAVLTIAQNYGGGLAELKQGIKLAQYKFRYELAEPRIKRNVDKLYIQSGDSVSFVCDDGFVSYKNILLKAPENTEAAIGMMRPTVKNINDLNYRVENIEVSKDYGKIGKGDGVTDDTQAIQTAIGQTANINPSFSREVVLTSGVYRISSPLKMNVEQMTLRGEGEVILWATEDNYEPIIRVMAGGCKIENIKIYLAKTDDDTNYTNTGKPYYGYLKSYKETAAANAEGNGHYCGIYVDTGGVFGDGEGVYGFYNLTVRDVTVQGAFRYSTKFIEKSYGVYFPKTGYCYFTTIDNCFFNSVMCGLYLGGGQPSDVHCKFDVGEDIYGLGALSNANTFQHRNCYNIMGCRYGVIAYSYGNTLRIDGQASGEDSMNPYVYDGDEREMPLDENTAWVENTQAYRYNSATDEFEAIEGETVMGFPAEIGLWRKVTDAGVLMHGKSNLIEEMIFDHQRTTYGAIYLTSKSSCCMYTSYSASSVAYGRTGLTWMRDMYIPIEKDANGKYVKWALWRSRDTSENATDCGFNNRAINANTLINEHRFGAGMISSLDKYGLSLALPRTIDKTDDVAAYADKVGSVKCYYVNANNEEEEITEFWRGHPQKNKTVTDISPIFRPECNIPLFGIATGFTFKQIPTHDHPIIIEIDFGRSIMGISSGIIRFNRFICADICFSYFINDEWTPYFNRYEGNMNAEFLWNTYNFNGTHNARHLIDKVRIKLGDAYMPMLENAVNYNDGETSKTYPAGTKYNPDGFVGISKIFIADVNGGGRAFMTKSGGDVYGDINADGRLESKSGIVKLGNTSLTEEQLQKLLNLIDEED
ncbi:MAG: hypothetical protein K5768_09155 [Firmicutes bacterium]|nr:hypothetical protein [Bacillota bacterium]